MPKFSVQFGTLQIPALKHLTNAIRNAGFRDPLFPVKVAEALETLAERRINLTGSVEIPALPVADLLLPSIDETDLTWYGTGTIDGTTDPLTFTPVLTGQSRFGMTASILSPGTGYTSASAVVTDSLGNTRGAAITLTVSGGQIVDAEVTNSGFGLVPPLTVTVTGPGTGAIIEAEIGRQFNIGDYIVWNDPTVPLSGPARYSYEIDQITNIVWRSATDADFTLARRPIAAYPGVAQLGSPMTGHTAQNFFRLIPKTFQVDINPTAGPGTDPQFWNTMLIAAAQLTLTDTTGGVQGTGGSGTGTPSGGAGPVIINLAPPVVSDPHRLPPCPGFRTGDGAAYISAKITGTLAVGKTLDTRIKVAGDWGALRVASATVRVQPVGAVTFQGITSAAIVVYLCYFTPDLTKVGLLDTLVIPTAKWQNYNPVTDAPNGPSPLLIRQMPYHQYWVPTNAMKYDWPPTIIPILNGAIDANGNLQNGLTIDPTQSIVGLQPDGYIDAIVFQVGSSTAGSDLTIAVET